MRIFFKFVFSNSNIAVIGIQISVVDYISASSFGYLAALQDYARTDRIFPNEDNVPTQFL